MRKTTARERAQRSALETIAAQSLGLPTLETRHADALDFHDLAVWQIRAALERAFEAGRATRGRK